MIGAAAAALASPWLGRPIQQQRLHLRRPGGAARIGVSAASFGGYFVDSSIGNVVRDGVLSFHGSMLEGSSEIFRSSHSSLGWWSVAAPAALWFLLASPGSASGVVDFLASPFHALGQRDFPASEVEVGRRIGEGSFGVVYEGYIGRAKGKPGMHVVLKKSKAEVSGSSEMHNTEVYMNQYLQRNAPEAVADFLGTVRVSKSQAKGRLTEGLWLVWKFQGYHTLDHYMKQKTFPENLSRQLLKDTAVSKTMERKTQQSGLVVRNIMMHLLFNLKKIHSTGVVHRDVKPLNLVLAEDSETFKLVDLGAGVNLRSGFNYVPNETIMDPVYAPPEQYVMPTRTPRLPPDPICSMISPITWLLNTPDRFDMFSAGMVMMQLSIKSLRHDGAMKKFAGDLKRAGYDLNKWRKSCQVPKEEFSLLDADRGAGWELVTALLQPRYDKSLMIWPSLVRSRPSAAAALNHRFFRGSRRSEPVKIQLPDVLQVPHPNSVPAAAFQIGDAVMGFKEKLALAFGKLKRPEFTSAVAAVAPAAALGFFGIYSSWMLMQGLQTSAQISQEFSGNMIDSIGLSGTASVACFFLLVVKPLLDGSVVAKTAKPRTSAQLVDIPSYGEVRRLADEVGALDSRLSSLEAMAGFNNREPLEDRFYQQVARMRSLLSSQPREKMEVI